MSIVAEPLANGFGPLPRIDDILRDDIMYDVDTDDMSVWDKGTFVNELLKQGFVLKANDHGVTGAGLTAITGLKQGTYKGTRMALTEIYSLIEEAAVSQFDVLGFEPIMPMTRNLAQKRDAYNWSSPSEDGFPPHLHTLPPDQVDKAPEIGSIFDHQTLGNVSLVAQVVSFIIPENIIRTGTPFAGPTLADCEIYNREHPGPKTDIMNGENLGNKTDWYSDARFAQQHLSGVNPCTIERAQPTILKAYSAEADKQKLDKMGKLLSEGKDLFIQDYSYFRKATGVSDQEDFRNVIPEVSNVIFQLHGDGRLHPLAITIDCKGNLDASITIFNRRVTPDNKSDIDEKDDWAWRYAKTCVQTADWARHEIATHLVDSHMIEEAIIVATNRTIPEDHVLYETLSPHWFRTLALNKAARDVLVPAVIARLAGFGPSIEPKSSRAMKLIDWSYKHFDFQAKYIPNDLKARGFNTDELTEDKFRNYPYATDTCLLWGVLRSFVASVLSTKYKSDADVQDDPYISSWCTEIQTFRQIPTFPTITTLGQLVDAVTMCIHIASLQHTAVNYLQDYYYSFVPAKPPALCTPLPKDLATLKAYTEADLTAALPIGNEGVKWKDWLLAAQLPELLSFKVDNRHNLITYAKSVYNVNKHRTDAEEEEWGCATIRDAAKLFYSRLRELDGVFGHVSQRQTEGTVEYLVLQPEVTAVSILI